MKTWKEFLSEGKKSKEVAHVLQYMDNTEDGDYQSALKSALKKYPNKDKKELEAELEEYI